MTGRDRITKPSGCRLDAAPYLLGALEPGEAGAFVHHLEGCPACRDEVAALAPVLEALAAAAPPRRVRGALRRRVLRAAREEPRAPAGSRPGRVRIARRRSAPAGWLALGLAVAAAAVVLLGGAHTRARVIQASVGQAELRVTNGQGELIVEHLAALPADRTYELWLQTGTRTMPSTLFAVSPRGRADVRVPGGLHGVRRVLVTVEPRAGSLNPTTGAVVVARLA